MVDVVRDGDIDDTLRWLAATQARRAILRRWRYQVRRVAANCRWCVPDVVRHYMDFESTPPDCQDNAEVGDDEREYVRSALLSMFDEANTKVFRQVAQV